MSKHVLLVDDDPLIRTSLGFNLERAGYRTSTAADAENALGLARRDPPDVVLLDIGLPGMDGLEALRELRKQADLPIIFVTARRRELEKALGLELGADDYITKPFDLNVLLARVKAVLRRSEQLVSPGSEQERLEVGDLVVEPATHTATLAGKPLDLTRREFSLLHALALHCGQAVPVDELLAQMWGEEVVGEPQAVYVHVRWLREKIEEDPNHPRRIVTVRGIGYRLDPQPASEVKA